MRIKELPIHSKEDVMQKISSALKNGRSLSLIRLCSGEAFTLAHGVILPLAKIPWWVEYAGVKLPNEEARQALLAAVESADIVGLSTDYKHWSAAPLLEKALSRFNVIPRYVTEATVNWVLHRNDQLYKLIGREPTALVGRLAPAAAPYLKARGVNVVSVVTLENFDDLPKAKNALLNGPKFRVALVAAGIPAAILCPRLARKTGCIAVDYGHVINDLIQPGFNVQKLAAEKNRWRSLKSRK